MAAVTAAGTIVYNKDKGSGRAKTSS